MRKELEKAKIDLMFNREFVFLSSVLLALKCIEDPTIKTACTDGRTIRFNPTFFLALSPDERIGLICHEVWHVALKHNLRSGKRNPEKWNHACDYVVNLICLDAGLKLPANGLVNTSFSGMSTEQVYDQLPDDLQEPDWGYDLVEPSADDATALESHIDMTLMRAMTAATIAKAAGSIPGQVQDVIASILKPKVYWGNVLNKYFSERAKDDFTWTKRNRRFSHVYLPSAYSEQLGLVRFFVDISCSVSDTQFNQYISEIVHVKETYNPKMIEVIEFDTCIKEVRKLHEGKSARTLKFTGRGGTDIEPVFDYINDNPKAEVNIIITDGEFSMPEEPDAEIIWVIDDNDYFESKHKIIHIEM